MTDPAVVEEVRKEVKQSYVCEYCGASKRANVYWERLDHSEIKVEIECTAFLKGGVEMCAHTEIRYMVG